MTSARFIDSLDAVDADAWDALCPNDDPFVAHAFLHGLERHSCLQRQYGWRAHHLLLETDGRIVAAAPAYLKSNSHGEFVFDHAWAEAYWHHGVDYHPKLLCAVPYSPVPGARLLGTHADPALPLRCLDALRAEADRLGLSSAHVNFIDPPPDRLLAPDWLRRFDWQFHWRNCGWLGFDDFLADLSSKKRKNIRHERTQVAAAGIAVQCVHGDEASDDQIAAMHGFYLSTFHEKGNTPILTLEFFRHIAASMPRRLLLVLAERRGRPIAGALYLRSSDTLYGRYWGASEPWPGLHFELCYYQGIEYCLQHGLSTFQPGAQGEHKVARGFLPTMTHSLHYIADQRFRAAIANALRREADWLQRYRAELMHHSPYRDPPPAAIA